MVPGQDDLPYQKCLHSAVLKLRLALAKLDMQVQEHEHEYEHTHTPNLVTHRVWESV